MRTNSLQLAQQCLETCLRFGLGTLHPRNPTYCTSFHFIVLLYTSEHGTICAIVCSPKRGLDEGSYRGALKGLLKGIPEFRL